MKHQSAIRLEAITEEINSLHDTNIKTQIFPFDTHWSELSFFFFGLHMVWGCRPYAPVAL
jgi:hypothetical protein